MASSHPSDQQYFQKRQAGDSQYQQPGHLIAVAIGLLFGLGCFAASVEQRLLPPVAVLDVPPEDCLRAPQFLSKRLEVGLAVVVICRNNG